MQSHCVISIPTIICTVSSEWQKRSMGQNKEPRNKPTQTRSLASEQSRYNGEEIAFQQLVEQLTATCKNKWLWGWRDVAVGKNSSCSCRDPASTPSTLVCAQLPLTPAPGDSGVFTRVAHIFILAAPHLLPLLLIAFRLATNPLLLPSLFPWFWFGVLAQGVSFLLFTRAQERICSQKHAWCEGGMVLTGSGSEHLVTRQGYYFGGSLLEGGLWESVPLLHSSLCFCLQLRMQLLDFLLWSPCLSATKRNTSSYKSLFLMVSYFSNRQVTNIARTLPMDTSLKKMLPLAFNH